MRRLKKIAWFFVKWIPKINVIFYTKGTQTPVKFKHFIWQKVLGINKGCHWPTHFTSKVLFPENIHCGIETCPGYSIGNYIQAFGGIYIGDYTQIGPNVGIISANHNIYKNDKHITKTVILGKYCWLGMNSVILPGTQLGDFTIVAAGAIVTKSFRNGYCILAGNPAKVIRVLDKNRCIQHKSNYEYHGFVSKHEFVNNKKKYTNV